jgi:hypothetical protein
MKATIDFDDVLYRRLKIVAAQHGRTVRELVAEGVRYVLNKPPEPAPATTDALAARPAWFGSLRKYARNADGDHSMTTIRKSIAQGRTRADRK